MPNAVLLHGNTGLDWLTAKYKIYVMDKGATFPNITSAAPVVTNASNGMADLRYTTSIAHNLVAGSKVIITGLNLIVPSFIQGIYYDVGSLISKVDKTTLLHRVVNGGSSHPTIPPTFATYIGGYTASENLLMKAIQQNATRTNLNNGVHIVKSVPTSTTFIIKGYQPVGSWSHSNSTGKAIRYGTYLSEWGSANIKATSATLTGKQFTANSLSASNLTIDTGVYNTSNAFFLLVRTAALDANADLADSAKQVVAYWDTTQGISYSPFTGAVNMVLNNFIQL